MKKCAVENCLRERLPDALVCRVHLGDLWGKRLERTPDGFVPEWVARARRNALPAKELAA